MDIAKSSTPSLCIICSSDSFITFVFYKFEVLSRWFFYFLLPLKKHYFFLPKGFDWCHYGIINAKSKKKNRASKTAILKCVSAAESLSHCQKNQLCRKINFCSIFKQKKKKKPGKFRKFVSSKC